MELNVSIRMATEADAEEILNIYSPYVTDTVVSFEYDIPSVVEFSHRISDTLKRYPYIVALKGKNIVGFAYASAFKNRAAYDWAAETTVYVKQDFRGRGVGKKLYVALEELLKRQNIINSNACIAYTSAPNEHLDNASMLFHENLGYSKVAHFTKCGYKFGVWYDMIWMEKMLGEHPDKPEPVIAITELTL